MSRPTLTTARLRLEPLVAEHTEELVALDADPDVVRFVFGRPLTRSEVIEDWMPRRLSAAADARGLGYWAGHDLAGKFLGWWCLIYDQGRPDTAELGYRLQRSTWGQGYATEGARALLRHAFETVGLATVWAAPAVEHAASRAVLTKLGMPQVRVESEDFDFPVPNTRRESAIHEITGEEYIAQRDRVNPPDRR